MSRAFPSQSNFAIVLAALGCWLAGCTTARESFPGEGKDLVWTAMVAAAQTPDYDHPDYTQRWIVRENDVHVMDEAGRIEVYRRLERELHRPGSKPLRETRTFKFGVQLEQPDPKRQPDLFGAKLASRGWSVPAHFWDEADRYFADVRDVLGEKPAETVETASTMPSNEPSRTMYDN